MNYLEKRNPEQQGGSAAMKLAGDRPESVAGMTYLLGQGLMADREVLIYLEKTLDPILMPDVPLVKAAGISSDSTEPRSTLARELWNLECVRRENAVMLQNLINRIGL